MEFMRFPNDSAMERRASSLNNRDIFTPRIFDWDVLETCGFAGPLQQLIVPTYGHPTFTDDGLLILFKVNQPVYKPLLVEFLASYKLDDFDLGDRHLNTKEIIHFRLCGRQFNLTLLDFAAYLGFHDGSPSARRLYLTHLKRATTGTPPNFNLNDFWEEIGMEHYVAQNCRESHLRSPIIRLAHRFLTWTIMFNSSPEKLNVDQIKGLHFLLHRENRWHLPLTMAIMFKAALNERQRKLPGGQFVTLIALKAGILTPQIEATCGPKTWPTIHGKPQLVSSMLLKKNPDGTYEMYEDGEKKEDEAGPSTSTRPKRTRTAPPMQPQGPAYNLQYAIHQANYLGHYMDDVSSMMWRSDARAEMRHQTPFGEPYPPQYGEGWEMPMNWETRMAGLNLNEEEEEEDE